MKIFFEGSTPSYFSLYKVTLVPGENKISDKVGEELLKAHELECKHGGAKPRLRKIEMKPKPVAVPQPAASKVGKKGAK